MPAEAARGRRAIGRICPVTNAQPSTSTSVKKGPLASAPGKRQETNFAHRRSAVRRMKRYDDM